MNTTDAGLAGACPFQLRPLCRPASAATASSTPRHTTTRRCPNSCRPVCSVNATSARLTAASRPSCSASLAAIASSALADCADSSSTCHARESLDASAAGGSSTTTCALVPPMPNALTPARRLRPAGGLHGTQPGVHVERARGEVDLGIRRLVVQARRKLSVLERESGLDQAGHARRGVEVSEVALHAIRWRRCRRSAVPRTPRSAPRSRWDRRATWRCRGSRCTSRRQGDTPADRMALAITSA